jgi:hypothetical protein
MAYLTQQEKSTLQHLANSGDLYAQGYIDHDNYLPIAIPDPGTTQPIPVVRSGTIAITTAAAETNTLAIPSFRGQKLVLCVSVYAVGNRVITSSFRINQAGNTIMTFGAVGDCIVLEAVVIAGVLRWQVTANDGVALS